MDITSGNSLNKIYSIYFKSSYLFVRSYIHDDFIAEDIVADSLVKLWEASKKKNLVSIEPYLFTILKNRSLDYLKHKAVKQVALNEINEYLSKEFDLRISILESCDPKEIFSDEIKTIVHSTLASLPDRTRRIFEMSRFEYKSNKEIAEILGITIKGVDYHIAIVLKELKKTLKDYLPFFLFLYFH